jgi:dienelactone hydrolase
MLKQFYLLVLMLFLLSHLSAQQIGHTTVVFNDSSRSNRQINTEVYYPSATAGTNTPIEAGEFPLIVFGHGFVMTWSAYQNIWDALVPEGYILAFPTTEGSLSPSHSDFAQDLRYLITAIQAGGAGAVVPPTSIGSTSAIMGHSMGGGCSFLAAENNTSITTMVSFAAAITNPSSVAASQHVSVPVLIFSGSNDCVAPPSQHQDIMYDSTAAAFKTQIYITGGGHCYFANSNFNCTLGESTCSPSPAISRTEQQSAINDFLKPWLDYFLKNDCAKANEFQDSLLSSTRISYRQNQPIACVPGGISTDRSVHPATIFPNPFSELLTIVSENESIRSINVFNSFFQIEKEYNFENIMMKETIDLSSLRDGIYFLKINNDYWRKIIKDSH